MNYRSASLSPVRLLAVVVLLLASLAVSSPAYTLMVVPARYSVLQVAFDVLARHASVLVSYQAKDVASEPVLHAWNGSEWTLLTLKDYREGNFLQSVPERAVLVGDDATLPSSILEASAWISEVVRVRDLTSGALVNEFGHILQWRPSEWNWFAKRYNLNLKDESEARRKSSWYDQAGPLPDRPRIIENITGGKAAEPQPVPVTESVEPIPAPAPVEPVAAPEVVGEVVPEAAPAAPMDPAAEPPADMPTK